MIIDADAPGGWPYEKAAAEIRRRIAAGTLGPRLPSRMKLADELGVAVMTVERAIKVLKDEGLIVTEPGRGTFVRRDDG